MAAAACGDAPQFVVGANHLRYNNEQLVSAGTAPDHAVLCEVSRPVSQWSESDCILKCGGGDWLWAANVDVRLGPRKGDVTGMLPAGAVTALASS